MEIISNIIEYLDKFTIIVSCITLIFAGRNWWNNRKLNRQLDQDITITLSHSSGQSVSLPHTIKRRHLTRSEIQGILANCYQGGQRYDIPYLGSKAYSDDIKVAQNGGKNYVTIPIEDMAEFHKFTD